MQFNDFIHSKNKESIAKYCMFFKQIITPKKKKNPAARDACRMLWFFTFQSNSFRRLCILSSSSSFSHRPTWAANNRCPMGQQPPTLLPNGQTFIYFYIYIYAHLWAWDVSGIPPHPYLSTSSIHTSDSFNLGIGEIIYELVQVNWNFIAIHKRQVHVLNIPEADPSCWVDILHNLTQTDYLRF